MHYTYRYDDDDCKKEKKSGNCKGNCDGKCGDDCKCKALKCTCDIRSGCTCGAFDAEMKRKGLIWNKVTKSWEKKR